MVIDTCKLLTGALLFTRFPTFFVSSSSIYLFGGRLVLPVEIFSTDKEFEIAESARRFMFANLFSRFSQSKYFTCDIKPVPKQLIIGR